MSHPFEHIAKAEMPVLHDGARPAQQLASIDQMLMAAWDSFHCHPTEMYWVGPPEELREAFAKMGATFTDAEWQEYLDEHLIDGVLTI